MAEEFQAAEVCGGTWWASPRATFNGSPFIYGGCWQNDLAMNMKTRSTDESSGSCVTAISPDSTFQTPTTSTTNWNQALLVNGTTEDQGYNQTLTEILNNIPAGSENTSSFSMNQEHTSSFISTSYGYPSSLLQNLFDCSSPPPPPAAPPPQQPLYDFQGNLDNIDRASRMPRGLHLANKTPFWNASSVDLNNNRTGFFASSRPRFVSSTYQERPNCPNIKSQNKEIRDMGSPLKKGSGEPTLKRTRLETPSPLPAFKVRKEKLGDRVTALQQLVSPFGKTDTASVLHEAIEYIKLLHDQVNVLSTPYMKNGAAMQVQQMNDKLKDSHEGVKQRDLKSRGLCLVPVSSTFPVATDATPEYWTSSFGSAFK